MKTLPCWHVCNVQLFINTREKCGNELWTQCFLSVLILLSHILPVFIKRQLPLYFTFCILSSLSICFCLKSSFVYPELQRNEPSFVFPFTICLCWNPWTAVSQTWANCDFLQTERSSGFFIGAGTCHWRYIVDPQTPPTLISASSFVHEGRSCRSLAPQNTV